MSMKTQVCVLLNHFTAETKSTPVRKEGPPTSVPLEYVSVGRLEECVGVDSLVLG